MSHAAIVLAAGYGSLRDDKFPKVLEPAGDQSLLAHLIGSVRAAAFSDCVVVVNPTSQAQIADCLQRAFPDFPIRFAVQDDRWGTGDAASRGLLALRDCTLDTVTVLMGDMPLWSTSTLRAIRVCHQAANAQLTMATFELGRESPDCLWRYARVRRDEAGLPCQVIEYQDLDAVGGSNLVTINPALMTADPDWLLEWVGRLRMHPHVDGRAPEKHFPEIVRLAVDSGMPIGEMRLTNADELLGVNTSRDLELVRAKLDRFNP